MSANRIESWNVDLADVGPIYPMVGWEGVLVLIGFVFWILWQVWQIRFENKMLAKEAEELKRNGTLKHLLNKIGS